MRSQREERGGVAKVPEFHDQSLRRALHLGHMQ
jgi:hypothetical protein